MYEVTGKKGNHIFRIVVPSLRRAVSFADRRIEDGYEDVKIQLYTDQLPLFENEIEEVKKCP